MQLSILGNHRKTFNKTMKNQGGNRNRSNFSTNLFGRNRNITRLEINVLVLIYILTFDDIQSLYLYNYIIIYNYI